MGDLKASNLSFILCWLAAPVIGLLCSRFYIQTCNRIPALSPTATLPLNQGRLKQNLPMITDGTLVRVAVDRLTPLPLCLTCGSPVFADLCCLTENSLIPNILHS